MSFACECFWSNATKVDYIPNGAMYGHILLAILPLVAMYLVLNNMIEITTKIE